MNTTDILVIIGFVLVVVLFMGPAMWSSSTEPLLVTLWKKLTGSGKKPRGK